MFDRKPRTSAPLLWLALGVSLTAHLLALIVFGGLSITVPLSYALDTGKANPTVDVQIVSVETEGETG